MASAIDTIGILHTSVSPEIIQSDERDIREVMRDSVTRIRELVELIDDKDEQIAELRAEVRELAMATLPEDMFTERVDTGYILDTGKIVNHLEDELEVLRKELLSEIYAQQIRLRSIL